MTKTITSRHAIGQKIRQLRLERRWTQARLADLLGISQNYLSELERGEGSFSAEQLLILLKQFNVSIDYFVSQKAPIEDQIQNALARQGATHLFESNEIIPSERLKAAIDAIREALVSAKSSRQITAIAPILVSHIGHINLDMLHDQFQKLGLEYRLGWVIENTLEAIKIEEADKNLPMEWRLRYRRARVIIDSYTRGWRTYPGQPGNPPPYAVLDPDITSERTFHEVRDQLLPIATRWRIVTRISVYDFAHALRAARGAN